MSSAGAMALLVLPEVLLLSSGHVGWCQSWGTSLLFKGLFLALDIDSDLDIHLGFAIGFRVLSCPLDLSPGTCSTPGSDLTLIHPLIISSFHSLCYNK